MNTSVLPFVEKKDIHVYRTHIEISPYQKNESFDIQKLFSKWNIRWHRYEPIAYVIEGNKLYIPKIADLSLITNIFNSEPIIETDWDICANISRKKYKMNTEPRDRIQEEAIQFLKSEGRFRYTINNPQYGLNLDTGDGKTFCAIKSIIDLGMKAIIILPKTNIKAQWADTFAKFTNVPEDQILNIESVNTIKDILLDKKEPKWDFYTINHQLITSVGQKYGWDTITRFFKKLEVGIKVFDESHTFFVDSMKIDFFTNTKKTFYLTATFTRSDYRENIVYQLAYSNVNRFGEETKDYEEKRKHIIMIPIRYSSGASQWDNKEMLGSGGSFSSYKFIEYGMTNGTIYKVLEKILEKIDGIEGKILITVPKIESTEYFADHIRDLLPGKDVRTIHSKNSQDHNMEARKDADIIVSTIKSVGAGDDIKGLRVIINFEPIGSWGLAHQLRGRLREYSKTDNTFLFYPIDTSIPKQLAMYKRILPDMVAHCKEIMTTDMYDI